MAQAQSTASSSSLMKSTGIMTIATLLSRMTGLVRTWAMAFALGNTLITSAYQVANNMPNVIYDLVAGGIIGAAFLPIYLLEKEKRGSQGADEFASNILNITLVVMGLITILATIFAPEVIATQTFTVSAQDEIFNFAVTFFRIFAIQIIFYGLGGVITGVLNANRIYGLPSLAPAINNTVVIASFIAYIPLTKYDSNLALMVLAVGTSLGVVAQFGIQIPALIKHGFNYVPKINLKDPALKEALRIAVPTLVYIVGTLFSFSCRNAFSLNAGSEGPATLSYAWTWYQLPYGVIAVSLSTAFLTEMSTCVAQNDYAGLRTNVRKGLRSTLFLIIPLSALMLVLAGPIIQIFRAGAFSHEAVSLVSQVLAVWVISLPLYAGQMYLYRVFAALRQFMTFAWVSCALSVIQIALYAVLGTPSVLGLIGIAVADIVYFALRFFIMDAILRRRIGDYGIASLYWMSIKVLAASIVGAAVAWELLSLFPAQSSTLGALGKLTVCGCAGLLVVLALSWVLRIPEMNVLNLVLTKLLGKRAWQLPHISAPKHAAKRNFKRKSKQACRDQIRQRAQARTELYERYAACDMNYADQISLENVAINMPDSQELEKSLQLRKH